MSPSTTPSPLAAVLVGNPGGVAYVPDLPPDASVTNPTRGIWEWTNAQNGFHVALVHFTSDPSKDNEKFVEDARKGTSVANFEREYNIRWQSFRGKPVFSEDFQRGFHVSAVPLVVQSQLPIIRGWDFGLYPACVFTQLWPGMRLVVLKEICESGMGLERFLEEVTRKSQEWFPGSPKYYEVVDPAGFARSPNDERTAVSMLADRNTYRLTVTPGVQVPAERFKAVRKFLARNVGGKPALFIDPSCKMVIGGFDGGYHYAYNISGQLREKPEKNIYSHPADALQYVCTRVLEMDLSGNPPPPITPPSYGVKHANSIKEHTAHGK